MGTGLAVGMTEGAWVPCACVWRVREDGAAWVLAEQGMVTWVRGWVSGGVSERLMMCYGLGGL